MMRDYFPAAVLLLVVGAGLAMEHAARPSWRNPATFLLVVGLTVIEWRERRRDRRRAG